MTSTEEKTIAGRPINGTVTYGERNTTEQRSAEEFLAAVDTILATPGVEAFRWYQYTPYFADGDPCVFGIGELYVKLEGKDDGGDYEDGFMDTFSLNYKENEGKYPEIIQALKDFPRMDAFEIVLLDHFGDHARVTATTEGFDIQYYDHD